MKKIINRFSSSLKMADHLFEIYYKKAENKDLKDVISISLHSINKLIKELDNLNLEYNKIPNKSLMLGQIFAITHEKIQVSFINNDLTLTLRIIKALNTGTRASIKILNSDKHKIKDHTKETLKKIIQEQEKIESYFKDYANTII